MKEDQLCGKYPRFQTGVNITLLILEYWYRGCVGGRADTFGTSGMYIDIRLSHTGEKQQVKSYDESGLFLSLNYRPKLDFNSDTCLIKVKETVLKHVERMEMRRFDVGEKHFDAT